MDRSQIVILITLVIALLGSFPTARISKQKEKIYGGVLAEVFHHFAVAAYIGVLPAALLGSFLVDPLRFGIPLMLTCLAIALVFLFGYAVIEHSARLGVVIEDHGWTEDDARSSGL
jgi:hypothetical protein